METLLTDRIDGIGDTEAMASLAFVLDAEGLSLADVERLRATEQQLVEALVDADLGDVPVPVGATSVGDVARATLSYLAGQAASRGLVERALSRPPRAGQRDPMTLAIGGLVLLAARTQLELKRSSAGKWTFAFRITPLADAQLVRLLTTLMAHFGIGSGSGSGGSGSGSGSGSDSGGSGGA